MEPTQAVETGGQVLTWLDEYGALRCLAMIGLIMPPLTLAAFVWAVWKLARPISRLADFVEEKSKEGK